MSKHTPGTWFIWQDLAMKREGCDTDEIEFTLLENPDHCIYAGDPIECTRGRLRGHIAHICNVDADDYDFDDDEEVCKATALANARLIASAPDLLEALKEIVQFMRVDFDDLPMAEKVRAAIAKATGEQK